MDERRGEVRNSYVAGLLLILTALLIWAFYELRLVLAILFFGVVLAEALGPEVDRLQRLRLPRLLAALFLYALVFAVLGLAFWLVVPPLLRQAGGLILRAPTYAEQFLAALAPYLSVLDESGAAPSGLQIPAWVSQNVGTWALRAVTLPLQAFTLLASLLSVLFVSLMLILTGADVQRFFLSFLPARQQVTASRVLSRTGQRLGYFVRAQLILMAIVGGLVYVGLLILGVPFPVLLAILAFFGEAIPMVGPIVTAIPAILLGLTVSPLLALQVTVLYIVVQQVENYVLVPLVYSHQIQIHALVVFMAVLVGSSLMGVLGALLAVPVAVAIQVVVEELIIPWRQGQLAPSPPVEEPPRGAPDRLVSKSEDR